MSAFPPRHETDPDATTIRPATRVGAGGGGKPGRRRALQRRPAFLLAAVAAAVVILLAALYLVGYLMAGDKLPRKAQIAGVGVGGLSRAAAIEKLSAGLGPRASEPIAVSAGGRTAEVRPADAGLQVDIARSVDAAGGGKSLSPVQIYRTLTGGSASDAVVMVDEAKLAAAVQDLAGQLNQSPADAAVAYDGVKVRQTPAKLGLTVAPEPAATALRNSFLQTPRGVLRLPVSTAEPVVTDAEADQVVAGFANPAVSGPVRLKAGAAGSIEITPAMIAGAVTFGIRNGTLAPSLDAAKLRANAEPVVKKVVLTKPKDATVRIVAGRPKVIPAVNGASVSTDALAKAVEPLLTKAGAERTADLQLTGKMAAFRTEDAARLGVKEVTGQFTTYFPYLPYRNINIGRAAEKINNTLLKPGDTFSLNRVVGERTRANGFTEGFIIKSGKFKKELGGGVSQSATTTFNAMFFAGLKDVQHQPHTLYIDRYPPGREATVAWPSLDLKFQNDTKHGVLVQASIVKGTPSRRGSITVKMWSTKTYDRVVASPVAKSNFTTGRTLKDSSSSCEPMSPAPGFDADYQRLFYRGDSVVKRERFHWRYAPTDKVTCS